MLKERLEAELKAAMKDKDALKVSTVRMLTSAITYREKELSNQPLDDAGILQVIASEVKRRRDAVEEYTKGGRKDLADKESSEIGILQAYLPKQLTPEELTAAVEKAVAEVGATGPKDMGKVMKALLPAVQGKAEGKAVSDAVKARLAKAP